MRGRLRNRASRWAFAGLAAGFATAALGGCTEKPTAETPNAAPLEVGESREVELYAIRFDVSDFEESLTRDAILDLPESTQREMWLFDLDVLGTEGSPRLLRNALAQLRSLDAQDPALGPAERNLVRLMQMTPDTVDLTGTRLANLLDLAPNIGFSPSLVLADALGVGLDAPFIDNDALAEAIAHGLLATHPAARTRPGPVTVEHPDGQWPVAAGSIPITLQDVASDFATLGTRFGPTSAGAQYHPGFVVETSGADALEDDFRIVLRASTNALPFKGVDLTNASVGSVSALSADGPSLFDFSDPNWMRVEGLKEQITVKTMTFQLLEHPQKFAGGDNPLPAPRGNSGVWNAPNWALERVVTDSGFRAYRDRTFERDWFLGNNPKPVFSLRVDHGWFEVSTLGNIGEPPPPLYLWDLMAEVAQVRLRDADPETGEMVPEGQGHARFTLRDVSVGLGHEAIVAAIRDNLERQPQALVAAADQLLEQTFGRVDFYYYRPRQGGPPEWDTDWLYFVAPADLERNIDGSYLRDYEDYVRPGFYSDRALENSISQTTPVDGDAVHLKVPIEEGDTVYCADDRKQVFRVDVGAKPSRARVHLRITRVQ